MDKDDVMNTPISRLPEDFLEATTVLAENLLHSEPVLQYQMANKNFNEDTQASHLLQKLSQVQADLRKHQTHKKVTDEDLTELRNLQNEVQSNQTIQDLGNAQQAAILYLREINQEISNLIGIDFSSLARRSGTC